MGDGDLAVSEIYTNLGKRRISKAGLRAAVMLSDVVVKSVPDRVGDDPMRGKFLASARSKHVKWYLYQAPISPWRLWHFRVPAWLQKSLSHEEVPPESGGWILYRYVPPVNSFVPLPMSQVVTLVPGKWVKVDVPTSHHWPTRPCRECEILYPITENESVAGNAFLTACGFANRAGRPS